MDGCITASPQGGCGVRGAGVGAAWSGGDAADRLAPRQDQDAARLRAAAGAALAFRRSSHSVQTTRIGLALKIDE